MNMPMFNGLYVITDERLQFNEMFDRTRKILDTGIPVLQYREKTNNGALRHDRAMLLKELCDAYRTMLLVNDDVGLAVEINAHGAHIGKEDMAVNQARSILGDKAIIGVSCYNSFEFAKTAQQLGADYIAFGSFFDTQTKNNTVKADTELLRRAKQELSLPVVAIGGINPDNGRELVQAGADMLAVISCLYDNTEPQAVIGKLKKLFQE